jgi:hypothetical protein
MTRLAHRVILLRHHKSVGFWSNNGHRANGHYGLAAFRLEKLGQKFGRKLILD